MFESAWVHLGEFEVRTDHHDQTGFRVSTHKIVGANLGTRRSCKGCNFSKKLDSLIPRKLNSKGIGWIRYLLTRARLWVLVVPRLSRDLCLSISAIFVRFTCFSCVILFQKYDASILEILACHTLTLFALPRI